MAAAFTGTLVEAVEAFAIVHNNGSPPPSAHAGHTGEK
jgi:hypothetical protein